MRKQTPGDGPPDGVSLKKRFHAWWNGYELRPRASSTAAEDEAGDGLDATHAEGGSWSEARRQLAEALWSPGFISPGGDGYVEKLVSGCSLTAAETMLEIGIGMGGGTRTIIGKFGNYVTGYEEEEELAAAARRHAVTYNFDDKLEVINAPFEGIEFRSGYFRAALLRDVLYTVDDKAGVIGRIADSLKGGESFIVVTDFLFDADNASPELKAWMAVEERPVYPWTVEQLMKSLKSHGITPRIADDESDDYRAMVVDAWADYLKTIQGRAVPDEMRKQMAREGEFWARRVAALESGALRYYRVEGVRIS